MNYILLLLFNVISCKNLNLTESRIQKSLNKNLNEEQIYEIIDEALKNNIDATEILPYICDLKHLDILYLNKTTLLMKACKYQNEEVVKYLLSLGANVNLKSSFGNTALHIATEKGNENIIKILLNYGADPNIRDNNMVTALHIAVKKDDENIVKMLLDYKADPNIKDSMGNSPAFYTFDNRSSEIVKMLLSKVDSLESKRVLKKLLEKRRFELANEVIDFVDDISGINVDVVKLVDEIIDDNLKREFISKVVQNYKKNGKKIIYNFPNKMIIDRTVLVSLKRPYNSFGPMKLAKIINYINGIEVIEHYNSILNKYSLIQDTNSKREEKELVKMKLINFIESMTLYYNDLYRSKFRNLKFIDFAKAKSQIGNIPEINRDILDSYRNLQDSLILCTSKIAKKSFAVLDIFNGLDKESKEYKDAENFKNFFNFLNEKNLNRDNRDVFNLIMNYMYD